MPAAGNCPLAAGLSCSTPCYCWQLQWLDGCWWWLLFLLLLPLLLACHGCCVHALQQQQLRKAQPAAGCSPWPLSSCCCVLAPHGGDTLAPVWRAVHAEPQGGRLLLPHPAAPGSPRLPHVS